MIRTLVLAAVFAPAALAAQDTVRFTPTVQQPTFAVREPVLRPLSSCRSFGSRASWRWWADS